MSIVIFSEEYYEGLTSKLKETNNRIISLINNQNDDQMVNIQKEIDLNIVNEFNF